MVRLKAVDKSAVADAEMAELAMKAYRLRRLGWTLFDIAEELHVTESVVKTGLRISMQKAAELVADGTRQEMLAMELDRLDDLQRAVWPNAMLGDTRSVETALKVIHQRAKLLGLEETKTETTNQTLVVAGDTRQYIEALKVINSKRLEVEDGD